jgi:hypothetical protein
MIDTDPARLVLRLGDAPARKAPTLDEAVQRLTIAEHEMEQAVQRWSAAYVDWTAMRAQAQPVPASKPVAFCAAPPVIEVGDGMMRYERPMVFRQDGSVEQI